jgi:hypothetical protein
VISGPDWYESLNKYPIPVATWYGKKEEKEK